RRPWRFESSRPHQSEKSKPERASPPVDRHRLAPWQYPRTGGGHQARGRAPCTHLHNSHAPAVGRQRGLSTDNVMVLGSGTGVSFPTMPAVSTRHRGIPSRTTGAAHLTVDRKTWNIGWAAESWRRGIISGRSGSSLLSQLFPSF